MSRNRRRPTASTSGRDQASVPPKTRFNPVHTRWICLVLFVATVAVYAPVRRYDFVDYDDPEYVSRNVHVRPGITPQGLGWALTSREEGYWFPVTRLSHMLDSQLFGMRSGLHHLSSVLIHALASILLFLFLVRATSARWPSALVAFLFALHPLHVESVAWVAERKDVLCALFWFLGLWAYVRYAERPGRVRFLLVLLAFALGLMSKPMIVTFPFVLLLVDFWPLRRLSVKALREKIPLFALSGAAAVVTYLVQHAAGAVKAVTLFPLGLRIENALVSYIVYIVRMFWPSRLAVFYPYPAGLPAWQVAAAGLALGAISFLALRGFRERPYLAVGWLWYLVTLLPVIGLVQVGGQARADHFMYVPMAGLAIMLAWGAADVVRRWPRSRAAVTALTAAACLSCAPLAWAQVQHWENTETLFRHALAVAGENNDVAHEILGRYLVDIPGGLPEAISHLEAAVRIHPKYPAWHTILGLALAKIPERRPEALAELRTAVRISPDSAGTHSNLGMALATIPGRLAEAITELQTAVRIKPDSAEAHNNLGMALASFPGRMPEAIAEFQAALRINPDYAQAHNNLGTALANFPERLPEAMGEFQAALRINPDYAEAHDNLGMALASFPERLPEATAEFQAALRSSPDFVKAHNNLGMALANTPGRLNEAAAEFQAALRISPDYADAHYNLGIVLSQMPGRQREAITELEAGQRIRPDPRFLQILEQLRAAGNPR